MHLAQRQKQQSFFYISKLNCYNYSIYNLGTADGICYQWDQTTAKRGAVECTSSLKHYLYECISPSVTEICIWSDTCGGQNRNQVESSMLISLVNDKNKNILKITQKYFESGHSQSEVDTIHSAIETLSSSANIYMPNELFNITRMARPKQPYIVYELGTDDIPVYDMDEYSSTRTKNTNKYLHKDNNIICKVNWLKQKKIIYGLDESNSSLVGFCLGFEYDEEVIMIDFSQLPSKRMTQGKEWKEFNGDYIVLVNSATPLRPVEKKKLQGILRLVKNGQISKNYHGYYNSLKDVETVGDGEFEDEEEQ